MHTATLTARRIPTCRTPGTEPPTCRARSNRQIAGATGVGYELALLVLLLTSPSHPGRGARWAFRPLP